MLNGHPSVKIFNKWKKDNQLNWCMKQKKTILNLVGEKIDFSNEYKWFNNIIHPFWQKKNNKNHFENVLKNWLDLFENVQK